MGEERACVVYASEDALCIYTGLLDADFLGDAVVLRGDDMSALEPMLRVVSMMRGVKLGDSVVDDIMEIVREEDGRDIILCAWDMGKFRIIRDGHGVLYESALEDKKSKFGQRETVWGHSIHVSQTDGDTLVVWISGGDGEPSDSTLSFLWFVEEIVSVRFPRDTCVHSIFSYIREWMRGSGVGERIGLLIHGNKSMELVMDCGDAGVFPIPVLVGGR